MGQVWTIFEQILENFEFFCGFWLKQGNQFTQKCNALALRFSIKAPNEQKST